MTKRIISLLLCVLLLAGALPLSAWAEEPAVYFMPFRNGETGELSGGVFYELSPRLGGRDLFAVFYGTPQDAPPVEATSVVSSDEDVVKVTSRSAGEHISYNFQYLSLGTATLTVTAGGSEHTVSVTVELPDVGLYSENSRAAEKHLSDLIYSEHSEVYLVSKDDFEGAPIIKIGGETVNGITEKVDDKCYKITLPDPENYQNNEYYMQILSSDENNLYADKWVMASSGGNQGGGTNLEGVTVSCAEGVCYIDIANSLAGEDWIYVYVKDIPWESVLVTNPDGEVIEADWSFGDQKVGFSPTKAGRYTMVENFGGGGGGQGGGDNGWSAYTMIPIELSGTTYYVALVNYLDVSKVCNISEPPFYFSEVSEVRWPWYREGTADDHVISVMLITKAQDGNFYPATNNNISITIKEVWLEHVSGDEESFSFEQDKVTKTYATPAQNKMTVYFFMGVDAAETLKAKVDITVNGETTEQIVTKTMESRFQADNTFRIDRTEVEDDTSAKLAADLSEIVGREEKIEITLNPNGDYRTLTIPRNNTVNSDSYITIVGNNAVMNQLNSNGHNLFIKNISFYATTATKECPFDKPTRAMECCFVGYDTAFIGSNIGYQATFSQCTFIKNKTAVKIDGIYDWTQWNLFLNNEVAVDITDSAGSRNLLNIRNSTFIGNGKDYLLRGGNYTYYHYLNYYGDPKGNSYSGGVAKWLEDFNMSRFTGDEKDVKKFVSKRAPKIDTANASGKPGKVVTNPRMALPTSVNFLPMGGHDWLDNQINRPDDNTLDLGDYKPVLDYDSIKDWTKLYKNYTIADWGLATVIPNGDSASLTLSPAAFTELESEAEINVTDDNYENEVGKWKFAPPASTQSVQSVQPLLTSEMASFSTQSMSVQAAETDFDAGIETADESDGTVSFTVNGSSVLAEYEPELTVPVNKTWEKAFVTGPTGAKVDCDWDSTEHTMTFTVASGGKYKVREGDGSDYTPPSTGNGGGGAGDPGEEEPAEINFIDVKDSDYFANAVAWAVENGVTSGITNTKFGPNNSCTRAQFVAFLWRAAGRPEPETTKNPFVDVPEDYYTKAVLWASEQGIVFGTDETHFSPNKPVQRAQAVTFLYRYAGKPEVDGKNKFTDVKTGDYYKNAVIWGEKNGIVFGTGDTTFSPLNTCIRAQTVTFLYRYFK